MPKKRDEAYKKLAEYLNRNSVGRSRVCYGGGIVTISGAAGNPNPNAKTIAAWNKMLATNKVRDLVGRNPHNCAEAHLWLSLVKAGKKPKKIDSWVVKQSKNDKLKQDSPCPNCQQWVRKEFKSFNSK